VVKSPSFFIGATLESALSLIVPLNCLISRNGLRAVFSGATHTPIACTIMGWSFWAIKWSIYRIACFIGYMASGPVGIYHSQIVKAKYHLYQRLKGKTGQFLI
jgi:H+/Cl- antiporter ClcA